MAKLKHIHEFQTGKVNGRENTDLESKTGFTDKK